MRRFVLAQGGDQVSRPTNHHDCRSHSKFTSPLPHGFGIARGGRGVGVAIPSLCTIASNATVRKREQIVLGETDSSIGIAKRSILEKKCLYSKPQFLHLLNEGNNVVSYRAVI